MGGTVPDELKRLVDELTAEVRGLREEVHRRTRWVWGTIGAVVLVGALAWLGAYVLIDRNNIRQAAEQRRQAVGFCTDLGRRATAPVPPTATDLGRSNVRTAADAYSITGCDTTLGPLGPVDPDAYRTAPPTPRPG